MCLKTLEICLEIYELDPIYFVSAPGLAWQACLKKTEVKLELITDYDMILMIGKGIRGGICQATRRYAKANNKYMKNYDKNSESSYIEYLGANNLYGCAMSQKLPTNGFKWVEDLSLFNENLIEKYDEISYGGYFYEIDVEYPKRLFNLHKDLLFLPKIKKVEKVEKIICSIEDKKKICYSHKSFKTSIKSWVKNKKMYTE